MQDSNWVAWKIAPSAPNWQFRSFLKPYWINPFDARAWDYLALDLEPLGEIDRALQSYK